MDILIWAGAALSLVGLVGIVYSIFAVTRARKAGLTDEELRSRVSFILPINLGALMLSVLGLMMVIIGVMLG